MLLHLLERHLEREEKIACVRERGGVGATDIGFACFRVGRRNCRRTLPVAGKGDERVIHPN